MNEEIIRKAIAGGIITGLIIVLHNIIINIYPTAL